MEKKHDSRFSSLSMFVHQQKNQHFRTCGLDFNIHTVSEQLGQLKKTTRSCLRQKAACQITSF